MTYPLKSKLNYLIGKKEIGKPHPQLHLAGDGSFRKTRTMSIRYAKENDKEKRNRRKERERKVEGKI